MLYSNYTAAIYSNPLPLLSLPVIDFLFCFGYRPGVMITA
jgi:hypothetical protein